MKSVFFMDELKFTLFLSNKALGHFERLYCFKPYILQENLKYLRGQDLTLFLREKLYYFSY